MPALLASTLAVCALSAASSAAPAPPASPDAPASDAPPAAPASHLAAHGTHRADQARAYEGGLGGAGQIYLQADTGLRVGVGSGVYSGGAIQMNAAGGYFLGDAWAFGGRLNISSEGVSQGWGTRFGIGPTMAFAKPLRQRMAWLPSFSFLFTLVRRTITLSAATSPGLRLALEAPLVLTVTEGVAATVGPQLAYEFASSTGFYPSEHTLIYGVAAGLLAWF